MPNFNKSFQCFFTSICAFITLSPILNYIDANTTGSAIWTVVEILSPYVLVSIGIVSLFMGIYYLFGSR